jgi:hypothetical protein
MRSFVNPEVSSIPGSFKHFYLSPWNIGPKLAKKLNGCWLQILLRILSTPFISSVPRGWIKMLDGKWKDTGEDSLFAGTRAE